MYVALGECSEIGMYVCYACADKLIAEKRKSSQTDGKKNETIF